MLFMNKSCVPLCFVSKAVNLQTQKYLMGCSFRGPLEFRKYFVSIFQFITFEVFTHNNCDLHLQEVNDYLKTNSFRDSRWFVKIPSGM